MEIESKEQLIEKVMGNPSLVQRELNDRSLYEFLKWAWPELSGQPFVSNWHIPYLCRHLERAARRVAMHLPKEHDILINVPPGSTKTVLCTILFPVWCWTQWYWMRFITASYAKDLSLESAEYARDLIKSARFKDVYPELEIKSDKDTKSNYRIVKKIPSPINPNHTRELVGGNRFSTSVGAMCTGYHADIIIWDDPLNPEQAASVKEVITANRWMDTTIPTRKTSKANSLTIGIMQRLHADDPSGHILEKGTDVLHFCLPGEIRNYHEYLQPKDVAKYYKDDLFDSRRMDWGVLDNMEKEMGQYGFAGQIGQNPAPPGGGMFKVDHFQMVSHIIMPNEILASVRYWDKAASDGKGAFTTGIKIHKLRNGMFYVEDVKRGQWSSNKRENIILQTARADGTSCHVVVEQEPGSGGKESAQDTIRNLAGFMVFADRPTGDKTNRADPLSVQVNNGNLLIRVADWNRNYKEEFRSFPNSKYKDQVDGTSGGFNYLIRKKVVRSLIKYKH